jgi:hypothetical protein
VTGPAASPLPARTIAVTDGKILLQLSPGGTTPRTPRGVPDGKAMVSGTRLSPGGTTPRTPRGVPDGKAMVSGTRLSPGGTTPPGACPMAVSSRGHPGPRAMVSGTRLSPGGTNGVSPRTPRGVPDGCVIPGAPRTPGNGIGHATPSRGDDLGRVARMAGWTR